MLRNLWEACAAAALEPGSTTVLRHLQLAYRSAQQERDLGGALHVAATAMTLSESAFAATCYEELAAKPMPPADQILMLENAMRALSETRDTPAQRRVAHALAAKTPGHLHNAYRADYLDLLCGGPLEGTVMRLSSAASGSALDEAEQAHQRLLWAMIYSRREQMDSLRQELAGLEKATTWTVGERAVLAGLLAKAGEPARAWKLAEKLPATLLLNEESALAATAR